VDDKKTIKIRERDSFRSGAWYTLYGHRSKEEIRETVGVHTVEMNCSAL
jgi:hypothetical protein